MVDNEQLIKKIEELEARFEEKSESMDRKLDAIQNSIVFNTDTMNECTTKISDFWKIIRRNEMQRLGLSNRQVGLPRIDTDALISYTKQGYTNRAIAAALGCSEQTVRDKKKQLKAQGKL